VSYGPFPVWLDQILLVFTTNPISMVVIRAPALRQRQCDRAVMADTLNAAEPLVRPALNALSMAVIWTRLLGDNCLCIPLCAIAVAAYSDFLIRPPPMDPLRVDLLSCRINSLSSLHRRPRRRHSNPPFLPAAKSPETIPLDVRLDRSNLPDLLHPLFTRPVHFISAQGNQRPHAIRWLVVSSHGRSSPHRGLRLASKRPRPVCRRSSQCASLLPCFRIWRYGSA